MLPVLLLLTLPVQQQPGLKPGRCSLRVLACTVRPTWGSSADTVSSLLGTCGGAPSLPGAGSSCCGCCCMNSLSSSGLGLTRYFFRFPGSSAAPAGALPQARKCVGKHALCDTASCLLHAPCLQCTSELTGG